MQAKAFETNSRRAANALDALIERATLIRNRINAGQPADALSTYDLAEQAIRVGIHLGALEQLREAREWIDAERYGEEG
jgi:hypothetical protein